MFKYRGLFIFVFFLIISCKIYTDISSNYDKSIDFTIYKTFAWLPDKDTSKTEFNNQIIRNNTRNYFSHCMAERGYKADTENPDILLELIITETKKNKTITSPTYPLYMGYYQSNPYFYPYPNAYVYNYFFDYNYSNSYITEKVEYTEGGITLNIIDKKLNKLVWTGTAKGDLYDPSSIGENLHPAVYDILKSYPVPPIKKQKRPKKEHHKN